MTEASIPTIYADFNCRAGNLLNLSCNGTKADLKRFGIILESGLLLRVSDGDLATTGVVVWASEFDGWAIAIDLDDVADLKEP